LSQVRARRKPARRRLAPQLTRRLRESLFFVFLALAAYLFIVLFTYDSTDPGWSHTGSESPIRNVGGVAGAWIADMGLYLFGYLAYLVPIWLGYAAWQVFRERSDPGVTGRAELGIRLAGFLIMLFAGCGLAQLHFAPLNPEVPIRAGGILGDLFAGALVGTVSFLGATLFLLALFFIGVTLLTGISWMAFMDRVGARTLGLVHAVRIRIADARARAAMRGARPFRDPVLQKPERRLAAPKSKPRIEAGARIEPSLRAERERQKPLFRSLASGQLPDLSLLDVPPKEKLGYSDDTLEAMSRQVELKLADFGIDVQVVAVHPGPVITRFELQPAAGVKVSQIANLSRDLARGLSVISVRVVEVIPGKSVVGLEIPNEHRELVYLSDVLSSRQYDEAGSPVSLAIGKDISGQPVVVDLSRMPHLLVAGTTGSGKSVALNAMLLSLLYKSKPDEVRLILVDPKMLELSIYDGIPHLMTPVVTDMKQAANALRWCVAEMERRYRLMAALGVRSLARYNIRVQEAIDSGEPLLDPLVVTPEDPVADDLHPHPTLEPLPAIVVVVDEFADLMMVVGKKVEELIARLAQKARAAGIHLILATQRPSVDVITGLIKANIPCRIAFQVSSKVDSRVILDQGGAEQLLGHGDMLYLPAGTAISQRVHGAFVADHEVHAVVNALIANQGEPDYREEVIADAQLMPDGQVISDTGVLLDSSDDDVDPLYEQAVRIVIETRRASISGVQRRLKIGYNRSARMIEEMERTGIVSPPGTNGQREVLVAGRAEE
jgi:S-DNA-T family DNA segregation ATPase FtsK/SpoIIIE